jgi:uncharacterized membrane protein (DUF4010 family)
MTHHAAAAAVHHAVMLACGVLDCTGSVTGSTIGQTIVSVCQFLALGIIVFGLHRAWKEHRNGSGMKAISHAAVAIVVAAALAGLPSFVLASNGIGQKIIDFVFNNIF